VIIAAVSLECGRKFCSIGKAVIIAAVSLECGRKFCSIGKAVINAAVSLQHGIYCRHFICSLGKRKTKKAGIGQIRSRPGPSLKQLSHS
jgi:hypothetical protein